MAATAQKPTLRERISQVRRRIGPRKPGDDQTQAARARMRFRSASTIDDYVDPYVQRVVEIAGNGWCCLLSGVLGTGKSEVLRRAKAQIEQRGGQATRCVFIDVGDDRAQLTSLEMLQEVLQEIAPTLIDETTLQLPNAEAELRARLFDWMKRERASVVVFLDQAELLDRAWDIFRTIRALNQQQDFYGAESDSVGNAFVAVLSSTQSLRHNIVGVTSPLANIVKVIKMEDCPPDVRKAYWRKLLASLPQNDQTAVVNHLDYLCGGDPYLIENVARQIRVELDQEIINATGDPNQIINRVIASVRSNPTNLAPLLRRYGELLEDDLDALRLAMRLFRGEPANVGDFPPREEGLSACVWDGMFKQDGGRWTFRSELARLYFQREFIMRPERLASCLRRNQQFEEAIQYLVLFRNSGRDLQDSLEDVTLAWLQTADTPSKAWQIFARVLQIWFGDEAQLLRYYPRQQRGAHLSDAYRLVNPGQLETPADEHLTGAIRHAGHERDAGPTNIDIARRPVLDDSDPDESRHRWIFPLFKDGREYGAIVWARTAYEREEKLTESRRDHMGRWLELFNNAFRSIAQFERQSLSDVDFYLSRIQRMAQEYRRAEHVAGVLHVIMKAVTASFGLQFNRCVLLQAVGNRQLRGKAAIGHHSQEQAQAAWQDGPPTTFEEMLKRPLSAYDQMPADERTPLQSEVQGFCLDDWQADPVLGRALSADEPVQLRHADLAASKLGDLMRIDDGHDGLDGLDHIDGKDNPVFIVPLREGDSGGAAGRLLGALVVDKPFTTESVSQEQLDRLPNFANQVALVLLNEEIQLLRRLFDALSGLTVQRWSLQQTLDAVAKVALNHFHDLVTLVVISLWEETKGDDPTYPNRRQSTIRVGRSSRYGDLLKDWHYAYYTGQEPSLGPIDEALRSGQDGIYIPDLADWRTHNISAHDVRFDEEIQTVFSVVLNSDATTTAPRGVISFQTNVRDAYTAADRDLFKRLAFRITNILEKARVYEGLSRARHHTDQLNIALDSLLRPKTKNELYACILEQMREFFVGDGYSLERTSHPDSLALLAVADGQIRDQLAGDGPQCVERLVDECPRMRRRALEGTPVFIEHARMELVAHEEFGDEECRRHAEAGAEASVWTRIGAAGDWLFVMAWQKPRRMNRTERQALPVLAEIAARTNGVIEQERAAMKEQLANSLKIEDYELIEAEYTHQWNKRIRTIRNYAKWALEDLAQATAGSSAPSPEQIEQIKERLRSIEQTSAEALDRMAFGSQIKQVVPIPLKQWLMDLVERWNLLNGFGSEVECQLDLHLNDDDKIETRPVILQWITTELLANAKAAEMNQATDNRRIVLGAGFNPPRREYEISVTNDARLSRADLELIRSGSPIDRPNRSGRGVWIAAGQVQALLSGTLVVPHPEDQQTTFTIVLPERIQEN